MKKDIQDFALSGAIITLILTLFSAAAALFAIPDVKMPGPPVVMKCKKAVVQGTHLDHMINNPKNFGVYLCKVNGDNYCILSAAGFGGCVR